MRHMRQVVVCYMDAEDGKAALVFAHMPSPRFLASAQCRSVVAPHARAALLASAPRHAALPPCCCSRSANTQCSSSSPFLSACCRHVSYAMRA